MYFQLVKSDSDYGAIVSRFKIQLVFACLYLLKNILFLE